MTATAAPTIPAWATPGETVVVFHGTEGGTMPMGIDEKATIAAVTPFVITLTDRTKFSTDTLMEIGEDAPFRTRIADPGSDKTRLLIERFNKKAAMEEFTFSSMMFEANPTPERAQAIINALQTFI